MILRCVLPVLLLAGLLCAAAPASAASITLDPGRTSLLLGERTNVDGVLSGVADRSRRRIVVEIDPYPFNGRWVVVERLPTDRRGRFGIVTEPTRNTQMRARLGRRVVSPPITLYTDFPARTTIRGSGSSSPRVRFTVFAFPSASVRRGPVFAYLSGGPGQPYRQIGSQRWSTKTRRYVATTVRFPAGSRLSPGDFVVCAPEAQPDALGRPNDIDRNCGKPEIPRSDRSPTAAMPTQPTTPEAYATTPNNEQPRTDPEPGAWSFEVEGDEGDWITRGATYRNASPESVDLDVTPSHISASFGLWQLELEAPKGQILNAGHYPGASKSPFNDAEPGLRFAGDARACNEVAGSFTIHELVRDGLDLRRLRVSFEQRCEAGDDASRGVLDFTAR